MKILSSIILSILLYIILFFIYSLLFWFLGNLAINLFNLSYAYTFNTAMGITIVAYSIRFFLKAVTFKASVDIEKKEDKNESND